MDLGADFQSFSSGRDYTCLHDRLKVFSDEHARLVHIAIQSYSAIKTGNVGLAGALGTLLIRSLGELGSLIERTVPEIRRRAAVDRSHN
jgi:hypothetical protein